MIDALQHGDAMGSVWRPAEADVSIRPGWFYHPAEDARVKTAGQLVNLYLSSVGRNSKLLLNVPPTPEGLLHSADVANLTGMRERLQAMFKTNLATGRNTVSLDGRVRQVDLPTPSALGFVRLSEDIVRGQTVANAQSRDLTGRAGWTCRAALPSVTGRQNHQRGRHSPPQSDRH